MCIPKTVEEGVNDSLFLRFDFYRALVPRFNIITIPPRNYTGYTSATHLENYLMIQEPMFRLNTLTITRNLKQPSSTCVIHGTCMPKKLKIYKNWTGLAFYPHNLHSFNSHIQNLVSPPQRFTDKQSFTCNFLDIYFNASNS